MVESGEIIVPLVRSDANAADFLTKPMPPEKFFKFRNVINDMNIKPSSSLSVPPLFPSHRAAKLVPMYFSLYACASPSLLAPIGYYFDF